MPDASPPAARKGKPVIILGIGLQHDAGAALIANGQVLAAVNEERLNRRKLYWGWPKLAVQEVLRIAGFRAEDVELVAVANTTHSTYAPEWENLYPRDFKRRALIRLSRLGLAGVVGGSQLGISGYRLLNSKRLRYLETRQFEEFIRKAGIRAKIVYVDHHQAHLSSAYFTSGWDTCLGISLDGVGDGYCSRIAVCRGGRLYPIHKIPFYHTPGQYYGFVTAWAGFTPGRHEGKITGLAAHGDPDSAISIFRDRISYAEDRLSFVNHGMWGWAEYEHLSRLLEPFGKADVAASVQEHLEDLVTRYVRQAVEKTGLRRIALSGGIFANVKLNQRIRELEGVEDVYIHPGMGDGGLGVGSALAAQADRSPISPQRVPNVYLGTDLPCNQIERELRACRLQYSRSNNIELEIAKLLAEGYVVARANGRMEYGPRALGNRSILYQATDATVNEWLNKRLKRTEFMPFAPAVLHERVGDYYQGYPSSEYAAEFMTMTYNVTDRCMKEAPAIVHVDGTARPQVVSERTNRSFYKVLKEYERITGLPQIINTSFNMHEEPIVCTPSDAIRAFRLGHLDFLALGPYLARNPNLQNEAHQFHKSEVLSGQP